MTQIDFYTHVANKLNVGCRLAAKAHAQGLRVAVLCPDAAVAQSFDRMLWTVAPLAFVPHCSASHPLAARTPVVIDHEGLFNTQAPHDEVLLNLRDEWPPVFSRFQRLIEIVSTDDADRAGARARFKFYRDRGYDIRSHDLSATTA
jgi:DNA polymerase III subunit chi